MYHGGHFIHDKSFSIRAWMEQKLRADWRRQLSKTTENKQINETWQIRGDAEIWADMDIGQKHKPGPWDGETKAGNWLVKKQGKRRELYQSMKTELKQRPGKKNLWAFLVGSELKSCASSPITCKKDMRQSTQRLKLQVTPEHTSTSQSRFKPSTSQDSPALHWGTEALSSPNTHSN